MCSLRVCLATKFVVNNSSKKIRQRSTRQRLPDRDPRWNLFGRSIMEGVRTRMRDARAICSQPVRICFVRDLCGSNPALQYSPQLRVSDAPTLVYVLAVHNNPVPSLMILYYIVCNIYRQTHLLGSTYQRVCNRFPYLGRLMGSLKSCVSDAESQQRMGVQIFARVCTPLFDHTQSLELKRICTL
jgi:hypothetical protein